MNKIALLFSGKCDMLPHTANRLKSIFAEMLQTDYIDSIDIFCHSWNDDVIMRNTSYDRYDIAALEEFNIVESDAHTQLSLLDPVAVSTTSYQYVKDNIASLCTYHTKLRGLTDFSYAAQYLGMALCKELLLEYCKNNNTKYDYVIRFRYDLVIDETSKHYTRIFRPKTYIYKSNMVYVNGRLNGSIVNDYSFFTDFNTYSKLFTIGKSKFLDEVWGDVAPGRIRKTAFNGWFEYGLMNSFKIDLDNKLTVVDRKMFDYEILRTASLKDCDIQVLRDYNKSKWHNLPWEEKILKKVK